MKFKVEIEEKATYRHTVIVEAENINDVDEAVSIVESIANHPDDIPYIFDQQDDIKVVGFERDEDGDWCEFECTCISED